MTRLRDSIKYAEGVAWPIVKQEIADAVTPVTIDKLARTKQSRSNVRFVVEATIQALATANLLRTPSDADVIARAVEWHEGWEGDAPDEDMDTELGEYQLYAAVAKLLEQKNGRPGA